MGLALIRMKYDFDMVPTAALYASALALLYLFLSLGVIGARRRTKIVLGHGADEFLMRRIRAHGNFSEYVPLCLLLIALAEMQHAPIWLIHILGITLFSGRLIHAYGITRDKTAGPGRVLGMGLTFFNLSAGALINIIYAL